MPASQPCLLHRPHQQRTVPLTTVDAAAIVEKSKQKLNAAQQVSGKDRLGHHREERTAPASLQALQALPSPGYDHTHFEKGTPIVVLFV